MAERAAVSGQADLLALF